jgi:GMP synthase (glutamine-hydrolysing)
MSHGDEVIKPPPGFVVIARGKTRGGKGEKKHPPPIAAIADEKNRRYGLLFHPEVAHTPRGQEVLSAFAHTVCRAKPSWTTPNFIRRAIAAIRERAGKSGGVLLALSGGVDSAVAAALLHRALGKRLVCVFVDNGLLREGESAQVEKMFSKKFGGNLRVVDAQEKFWRALRGAADPEKKRRIIGRVFIEVFLREAAKIKNIKFLAQGTIYPDVIESAGAKTGKAAAIKSHHNVGGLPQKMGLPLIEPLRELFKDEVREAGLALGLPPAAIYRHPFPGPGLAVRLPGEATRERADILRRADAIFMEELRANNLYDKVAQAFAVLLPVKSVGVMGDARTYEYVAALRAVATADFMTADWARLPPSFLARVSNRIINEVPGINRVVYDISSKPPATVEWE